MNVLWLSSNEPTRGSSAESSNQLGFGPRDFPEWGIWLTFIMAVALMVCAIALVDLQVRKEMQQMEQAEMVR